MRVLLLMAWAGLSLAASAQTRVLFVDPSEIPPLPDSLLSDGANCEEGTFCDPLFPAASFEILNVEGARETLASFNDRHAHDAAETVRCVLVLWVEWNGTISRADVAFCSTEEPPSSLSGLAHLLRATITRIGVGTFPIEAVIQLVVPPES